MLGNHVFLQLIRRAAFAPRAQDNAMFKMFKTRSDNKRKATELYGAVVTQARNPTFYRDMGVADTPEGRYEMIALHLVLVLDKLGGGQSECESLRRETLEAFITDMDDAMREMGVGDQVVPKRVKTAAAGVYARGVAYREGVRAAGSEPLDEALKTYVYARSIDGVGLTSGALARYVRGYVAHLAALPTQQVMAAQGLAFAPEDIS
jgi:cytochrome b pre-mRNA-processing protein 3